MRMVELTHPVFPIAGSATLHVSYSLDLWRCSHKENPSLAPAAVVVVALADLCPTRQPATDGTAVIATIAEHGLSEEVVGDVLLPQASHWRRCPPEASVRQRAMAVYFEELGAQSATPGKSERSLSGKKDGPKSSSRTQTFRHFMSSRVSRAWRSGPQASPQARFRVCIGGTGTARDRSP